MSGKRQGLHVFCIERHCIIEEGFCRYVCPQTRECPLWRRARERQASHSIAKPIYYDQQVDTVFPTIIPHDSRRVMEPPRQASFTPSGELDIPHIVMHQMSELRKAPGSGHVQGYKWPECECAACCSELLINLMQDNQRSPRSQTHHSIRDKLHSHET